jgi:hypothetical protein
LPTASGAGADAPRAGSCVVANNWSFVIVLAVIVFECFRIREAAHLHSG